MSGETEKAAFTCLALKCKLNQETLDYLSIRKSYQNLCEIFLQLDNKIQAKEYNSMARWSEIRAKGQFLQEVDQVSFRKKWVSPSPEPSRSRRK